MRASLNPQAEKKGSIFVEKDFEVEGQFSLGSASVVTPGATPTIDASLGSVFTLTPAEAESISIINMTVNQPITLIVLTSGTSSYVLTFSTGFKTTGTLTTGTTSARYFIVQFISDGTNVYEVSRTTAIA